MRNSGLMKMPSRLDPDTSVGKKDKLNHLGTIVVDVKIRSCAEDVGRAGACSVGIRPAGCRAR